MKLLYLWIEDYKNIKQQGFNFSGEYKFDFNILETYKIEESTKYEKEIVIKGEITYENNGNDKNHNIFDKDIDISIIVGKNGSGKTSIVEFLTLFINHNQNYSIYKMNLENYHKYRGILIYELNNNFYIIENLSPLKINNIKSNIIYNNILNITKKENFTRIYYNNLIGHYSDISDEYSENVRDLSSNKFLKKNIKKNLDNNLKNIDSETQENRLDESINNIFYNYLIDNQTKIIKYLSKYKCNFINIKYFSIKIKKDNDYEYVKEHKLEEYSIFRKLDNYITSLDTIEGFYLKLFKSLFLSLTKKFKDNSTHELNDAIIKLKEITIKNIIDIIENLSPLYYKESWSKLLKILKLFYNYKNKILESTNDRIILEINEELSEFISQLKEFDIFNFTFESKPYFSGRRLSSGELYFCNIFSRIYTDFINRKNLYLENNNILIIFDEIEVALHPEWQKELISRLLEGIKAIFPNKKIHIIITTHSPFILSDIPKSNIIFLDKDEKGNCKVLKDEALASVSDTFGANIHTLLADSFFMKNGTMGEFAKNKINDVITFLNLKLDGEPKYLELNITQDEAKYIISIIGEPFLKEKLEEMYFRAFGNDKDARREALLRKKREIEKELEGMDD